MADKMCENNQVTIMGEIVSDFSYSHEVYGEGFYMVEVSVHRLSSFVDYIPVMVSERLVNVQESAEGKCVYITGQFRSFNRHEEHKNRLVLSVLRGSLNWLSSLRKKMQPTRFFWMDLSVRNRYTENTSGKGDRGSSGRSQPVIWQIGLYSLHLLGKKCKICIRIRGRITCADLGKNPEPRVCKESQ